MKWADLNKSILNYLMLARTAEVTTLVFVINDSKFNPTKPHITFISNRLESRDTKPTFLPVS